MRQHIPERMMFMAWKKQYTPEEQAAYQAQKRAEIEDIFRRIDAGVQQVFTSEKYRDYLKFMSRFTDYSARNTLLIAMQKPDATLVAAYGKCLSVWNFRDGTPAFFSRALYLLVKERGSISAVLPDAI